MTVSCQIRYSILTKILLNGGTGVLGVMVRGTCAEHQQSSTVEAHSSLCLSWFFLKRQ